MNKQSVYLIFDFTNACNVAIVYEMKIQVTGPGIFEMVCYAFDKY